RVMRRSLAWLSMFISLPVVVGGVAFASCAQDESAPETMKCPTPTATTTTAAAPPANEWTGFHVEVPLDPKDFDPLANGLFGSAAQSGQFETAKVLSPGIFVSASADPQTPSQADLTFYFDDGTNPKRILAVAPASYSIGSVFISTVDVAI